MKTAGDMSEGKERGDSGLAPYPLAMVICDTIWRDPYTGKVTLIGIFQSIGGPSFPLTLPVFSVYVAMTDGRGKIPITLQLVDVDENREPIFEKTDDFEFSDPRVIGEFCATMLGIQFPEPGEYRLKLYANKEFIIERRLLVHGPPHDEGSTQ